MQKSEELISVIMPTFNEESYLQEAISSVLDQTYPNIELIIVDNMSIDNTLEIIKVNKSIDNRIKYNTCDVKGPAAARNRAISMASGDYIVNMDADDIIHKDRIEKLFCECKKYNKAIIGSNVSIINKDKKQKKDLVYPNENNKIRKFFSRPFNRSAIMPGTIMAHKKVFKQFPYNEKFIYLSDWDFILRASMDEELIFYNVQETLYYYRLNENSLTFNYKERNKYNVLILINYFLMIRERDTYESLEHIEREFSNNILLKLIYNFLLILKYLQHNTWIIITKVLIDKE